MRRDDGGGDDPDPGAGDGDQHARDGPPPGDGEDVGPDQAQRACDRDAEQHGNGANESIVVAKHDPCPDTTHAPTTSVRDIVAFDFISNMFARYARRYAINRTFDETSEPRALSMTAGAHVLSSLSEKIKSATPDGLADPSSSQAIVPGRTFMPLRFRNDDLRSLERLRRGFPLFTEEMLCFKGVVKGVSNLKHPLRSVQNIATADFSVTVHHVVGID